MTPEQTAISRRLSPLMMQRDRWVDGMQLMAEHSQPWRPNFQVYTMPEMVLTRSDLGGWLLNLSDPATAALLLVEAMKRYYECRPAVYGGVGDKWRLFSYYNNIDLGTAAALALLAIWEEKTDGG